jgi:hypothetical protein
MVEESRSSEEVLERRLDPRLTVEAPATIVWGQERYEGTLRNLSARGFYLTLEVRAKELQVEDVVEVVVGEPGFVTREGTIVRVKSLEEGTEPVGVGLLLHESVDVRALTDRYL